MRLCLSAGEGNHLANIITGTDKILSKTGEREIWRRFVIDLEGDARIERQPERQDQRAGHRIAGRCIQFDRKDTLPVLLILLLHEDAALGVVGDLAGDAPVLIGFLKRGGPAGERWGLLGLNGEGGQDGGSERR